MIFPAILLHIHPEDRPSFLRRPACQRRTSGTWRCPSMPRPPTSTFEHLGPLGQDGPSILPINSLPPEFLPHTAATAHLPGVVQRVLLLGIKQGGSMRNRMKYVFVTGGVVSGLGKGITASSIGVLLRSAGLRVTAIKIGA